ncbi:MAG: hypothetical protein JOY60_15600 [Burkholderiaceae bacterium]|nr:hypothetical protein [Burkholderiaceae bacterium]
MASMRGALLSLNSLNLAESASAALSTMDGDFDAIVNLAAGGGVVQAMARLEEFGC